MAQKLIVVASEQLIDYLRYSETVKGKLTITSENLTKVNELFGIFFDITHANKFAQSLSKTIAGFDVHVITPSHGYFTQPNPVTTQKVWTPEGEYIVPTK